MSIIIMPENAADHYLSERESRQKKHGRAQLALIAGQLSLVLTQMAASAPPKSGSERNKGKTSI